VEIVECAGQAEERGVAPCQGEHEEDDPDEDDDDQRAGRGAGKDALRERDLPESAGTGGRRGSGVCARHPSPPRGGEGPAGAGPSQYAGDAGVSYGLAETLGRERDDIGRVPLGHYTGDGSEEPLRVTA